MNILLRLLVLWLCSTAVLAQPLLTRLVVSNVTPGLEPESFAAAPRTIYRQGEAYARVEEVPDPLEGVHLVIIRANADLWRLDLRAKSGLHQGDLPVDVSVPIYPDLYLLEFGREIEFMREYEVEPDETVLPDGRPGLSYGARVGELSFELFTSKDDEIPQAIQFLDAQGEVLIRIVYLEYQRDLPAQPKLFTVPEGFEIIEESL